MNRSRNDERLTDAILAATSGKSCARCQQRLLAFDGGGLRAAERELVELHLEHCDECRGMAQALAWLNEVFPAMVEEDPGEECTAAIFARTSRAPQGLQGLRLRLRERVRLVLDLPLTALAAAQARWRRALQRPLFPLEAAYVATLIAFLLVGTPLSPFHAVAEHSLSWLKGERQEAAMAGVPFPQDLQPLAGEAFDRTIVPAGRRLRTGKNGILHRLSARSEAWYGARELMGGVETLASSVLGRKNSAVAPALQDINEGFHHFWRGLRHPRLQEDSTGTGSNEDPALPRQGAIHE
jgi:hypothetical protein